MMTISEDHQGTITIVADEGWTDSEYDTLMHDHGMLNTVVYFDEFTSTETHDTWTLSRVHDMTVTGGGGMTEVVKLSPPTYLSYSQFTTYLSCGWAYWLTRVEKVEEDPAWWFAGGTAVHSACDAVDRALLAEAHT